MRSYCAPGSLRTTGNSDRRKVAPALMVGKGTEIWKPVIMTQDNQCCDGGCTAGCHPALEVREGFLKEVTWNLALWPNLSSPCCNGSVVLWSGLGLNMSRDRELTTKKEYTFSTCNQLPFFGPIHGSSTPPSPPRSRLLQLLHQSPAPSLAPPVPSPPSSQSNLLKHKSDNISS